MLHLMRMRRLQKFAAIHASIHKHLNAARCFYSRSNFKLNRAAHQFEIAGEMRFFRIHLTARNTLYTQSWTSPRLLFAERTGHAVGDWLCKILCKGSFCGLDHDLRWHAGRRSELSNAANFINRERNPGNVNFCGNTGRGVGN
jgi:hypothetical protein